MYHLSTIAAVVVTFPYSIIKLNHPPTVVAVAVATIVSIPYTVIKLTVPQPL